MMLVRPIRLSDLESLVDLARQAGVGLTTLPASEPILKGHVQDSERAFAQMVKRPGGERYLLVMEDPLTGQIVGCAGLVGRVGGFDPFYSYVLKTVVKESESINVVKMIKTLNLVQDHKGPSEIGTLFVHPDYRRGGHGRLMSLARFLFMAAAPERFTKNVIAEMRGNVAVETGSPFWRAIGRHFFDMPFVDADKRSAGNKQFIADLMPRHPIYVSMLPQDAQSVIGQVHAEAQPALRLLRNEGFEFGDEVDIFDAGPLYRAETGKIRTIRESRLGTLTQVLDSAPESEVFLISNDQLDFRSTLGRLRVDSEADIALSRATALTLGMRLGDSIRYVPARPSK
ncbi:MAG: arginine N-succinyltransferase [Myxococcales bacterium]|nr:arginine N-succinyltransferase [Myxococcales bacterium]